MIFGFFHPKNGHLKNLSRPFTIFKSFYEPNESIYPESYLSTTKLASQSKDGGSVTWWDGHRKQVEF